MARTRKVGAAGRLGARYGRRVRQSLIKIEKEKSKKTACPNCLKTRVSREAAGIWMCRSCGLKFAGKAYKP